MLQSFKSHLRRTLARGRAAVLAYHGVTADPLPFDLWQQMPVERFEAHLQYLTEHATVVSLGELTERFAVDEVPPATVALTFDDGFANNLHVVVPLLERYGLPATFFVCTGPVYDGALLWPEVAACVLDAATVPALQFAGWRMPLGSPQERAAAYRAVTRSFRRVRPEHYDRHLAALAHAAGASSDAIENRSLRAALRMLTPDELRRLAQSRVAEIGAHTVHHWRLSKLNEADAFAEIEGSRERLQRLGVEVRRFAYPYGGEHDYAPVHRELAARAGFTMVLDSSGRMATRRSHPLAYPRIPVGAECRVTDLDYIVGGGLAVHERRAALWPR